MTNEEQQAKLDAKLDHIIEKVDRVDEAVYGNGQPGLKVTVAEHGQTLGMLKKFFWIMVSGVVTLAGGVALAALL